MSFLDILIMKWEMIAWNGSRMLNFSIWAFLGLSGLSSKHMSIYPAIAFLVIGIEAIYAQTTKFNKLLPVKKSKILLVDFIIYYLSISLIAIGLFIFLKEGILQNLLYGTIIFSIGIVLRYCNSIIAGSMLMLSVIGSMFVKTTEVYKIINEIVPNNIIILIIIIILVVFGYLLSLTLYKKKIFINKI